MIYLPDARVTPEMSAWASALDADPKGFPLGASQQRTFDGVVIEARAEVHTWIGKTGEKRPEGLRGISLLYGGEAPAYVDGVDVSGFQPRVPWDALVAGGTRFVFIKVSEGATVKNEHAFEQWQDAGKCGLLRGGYHFFRTSSPPADQIAHFVKEGGEDWELPPVLDVEWQSGSKALAGMSPRNFASGVMDALVAMAKTFGRRPLIYTAPGFWSLMPPDFGAACAALADLWVAHYGPPRPASIKGWPRWAFWQHTDKLTVGGVRLDGNHFNGSLEALRAYAAGAPLPRFDARTGVGLQAALNALGIPVPPLVEDGMVGPKTVSALKLFQRRARLPETGLANETTVAEIDKALAHLGRVA